MIKGDRKQMENMNTFISSQTKFIIIFTYIYTQYLTKLCLFQECKSSLKFEKKTVNVIY